MNSRRALMPWVMWTLGASFYFYAFLQRTAPSVMVDDLMRDFDAGGAVIGNLAAFYFYAYMLVQIPTGVIADRWGCRRVLTGAAILCGLGSLLFAAADSLTMAYAGRFLVGAGAGFGFICTLKIAIVWFPAHRFALLSGLTMMAGMAGGVSGQAPMAAVVDAVGWRGAMTAAGVVSLVLAVAVWLVVRDRPDDGTGEDGGRLAAPASGTDGTRESRPVAVHLAATLRRRNTWIMIGYGFTCIVVIHSYAGLWGVPHLMQTYGLSRPAAAGFASLIIIGWGLTAPAVGWLSDRLGWRKPFLVGGPILTLAAFGLLLYGPILPVTVLPLLMIVIGITLAGMTVSFSVVREHNDAAQSGAAMSFVNMAIMASGAFTQPLIGWLLDLGWDGRTEAGVRVYSAAAYDGALWVFPAFSVAALIFALMVRETRGRTLEERAAAGRNP